MPPTSVGKTFLEKAIHRHIYHKFEISNVMEVGRYKRFLACTYFVAQTYNPQITLDLMTSKIISNTK